MKPCILLIYLLIFSFSLTAQFGEAKGISEHAISTAVKLGDMDNDGDLDVVFNGSQNKALGWYENLGSGVFGEQHIIYRGFNAATSLDLKDVDNNGYLDIVCTGSDNNTTTQNRLLIIKNFGNNDFLGEIVQTFFYGTKDVSFVDIDSDGLLDVIAASKHSSSVPVNGDGIFWYKNIGGGVIDSVKRIVAGNLNGAKSTATIDLDLDGDLDVVYGTLSENNLYWVENLGGGVFGSESVFKTNSGKMIHDIDIADMDNDGDLDIVFNSDGSGFNNVNSGNKWIENLGGVNNFSNVKSLITASGLPHSISINDIDGDGDNDIVSGNEWVENDGFISTGAWHLPGVSHPYGGNDLFTETGDIDGDGDIDILTIAFSSLKRSINVYINDGIGNFNTPIDIIKRELYIREKLLITDLDLNGTNDLCYILPNNINRSICYYENEGGNFKQMKVLLEDSILDVVDIIDLDINSDSYPDLIYVKNDGIVFKSLCFKLNLGAGNFDEEVTFHHSQELFYTNSIVSLKKIDLDNDGLKDILIGAKREAYWFKNLGNNTIDTNKNNITQLITSQSDCNNLELLDVDSDGDQDIILVLNGSIVWYENLGGSFVSHSLIPNQNSSISLVVDVDNDSDEDLVIGFYNQTLSLQQLIWFENTGSGLSTVQRLITNEFGIYIPILAEDIDGDGDFDFIDRSGKWLENLGNGNFGQLHLFNISNMGDFDGDGDKDAICFAGNFYSDSIYWRTNYFNSPYKLKGNIYYDQNQNGEKDSNESPLFLAQTFLNPNSLTSYTNSYGEYFFAVDTGYYSLSYQVDSLWHLTSDSTSYYRSLTSVSPIVDSLNFGFYPDTLISIVTPSFTGGFPRCNETVNYWLSIKNEGTTTPDGIVELELDSAITYVSFSLVPDSIVGQKVYWHFDSLTYYEDLRIRAEVQMPTFTSIGDNMISKLKVNEVYNGNIIYTNVDTLSQVLVCAYDPNDKNVTPKGIGEEGYIKNNQELEYLIRFQNTGNDTAINVMVRDVLSEYLDWNSLIPLASSHNMQVRIEQNGEVVFMFENIMLPDSNVNELGSQGFVKFKINMLPNLESTTRIENTARIYFDFNPAVVTNTVLSTIYNCSGFDLAINENEFCFGEELIGSTPINIFDSITWVFNAEDSITSYNYSNTLDTSGIFQLQCIKKNALCDMDTTLNVLVYPEVPINDTVINICLGDSVRFTYGVEFLEGIYYDSLSTVNNCDSLIRVIINIDSLPSVVLSTFNNDTLCLSHSPEILPIGNPNGGIYNGVGVNSTSFDPTISGEGEFDIYYFYTDTNGCVNSDTTSIVVNLCTGINDELEGGGVKIYPNPNDGLFTIEKPINLKEIVYIKVVDGKSRIIQSFILSEYIYKTKVDIRKESAGVYYLVLEIEGELFSKKIIKQ